jgi:ubiquinone/menaquinone biosynthesis C-methylase UbiE
MSDCGADKRPVAGDFVALLRHSRTDRGMRLMEEQSRCVRTGQLHEIVTTDEDRGAGERIDRVGFLGFAEFTAGGVIEVGDHVSRGDRDLGVVLGFDDCHFPNHLNILIRSAELQTAPSLGIALGDQLRFEASPQPGDRNAADPRLSLGEYVVGIEGLALLRQSATGDTAAAKRRLGEIRALLARLDEPELAIPRELPAVAAMDGYDNWAANYDDNGSNLTIVLEEEAVRMLTADAPPGRALDAACGTGRHAVALAAAGRDVTGVDVSREMIVAAERKAPGANFLVGDLESLPLDDETFSLVVCGLALSHLPGIERATAELSRVLRPGGRLVISCPHPYATSTLGWQARFTLANGSRAFIPEYAHPHTDYVEAFRSNGLTVHRCLEPTLSGDMARRKTRLGYEEAFAGALIGAPAVLVWSAERPT